MESVIFSSLNHEAVFGENTSYFDGYYEVNDERFSDEGNTDRGDQAIFPASDRVFQLLGIADYEDRDHIGDIILCNTEHDPIYSGVKVRISGNSFDNLKVEVLSYEKTEIVEVEE